MIGKTNCNVFSGANKNPQVSDLAEGALVKAKEAGVPTEFFLSKHNYESALNGPGRTLLIRKDCYDERVWNSVKNAAWLSSNIYSWLNSQYKSLFSKEMQDLMGTTSYYYTPSPSYQSPVVGSSAVFLASSWELTGVPTEYMPQEGTVLPISELLKNGQYNGRNVTQWSRTPYINAAYSKTIIWGVSNGIPTRLDCFMTYGAYSRPTFTIPETVEVDENLNLLVA